MTKKIFLSALAVAFSLSFAAIGSADAKAMKKPMMMKGHKSMMMKKKPMMKKPMMKKPMMKKM